MQHKNMYLLKEFKDFLRPTMYLYICTLVQLKKIGRKYKEQAEGFNKQLEELKAKSETEVAPQEGATPAQAEVEQQMATIKEQMTQIEQERDNLKQKLDAQSGEFGGAKAQLIQIQQVGVISSVDIVGNKECHYFRFWSIHLGVEHKCICVISHKVAFFSKGKCPIKIGGGTAEK